MLHRDPLIHFLVIGAVLFAALTWLGSGTSDDSEERIVIPADEVAALARSAELLQGRPPTDVELADLVEAAVREEVYYRRALALGLDVDDDEVRRRLIEKMQYLTEDTADPEPPEADLEAFFEANRESFRIPQLVTFDQVFFSPRMRGDAVVADAEAALASLQNGASQEDVGDSTPLDSRFVAADPDRVRVLFGDALTETVFSEPDGVWLGPFESDFGWHLVRVVERSPARDPDFAEVEAAVRDAYAADRLERANEAAFAEMRSHFDIAVQWDAEGEPEAWP
jgi:peptidyl-prolyl cis-trans isomerase C